jgi:serine O-acetyltransferase
MIQSYQDYKEYLEADKVALSIQNPHDFVSWYGFHFWNEIYHFQRLLRKTEYYLNCSKTPVTKAYYCYLRDRLNRRQLKLGGLYIHPNCFGKELSIAHPGSIVVNVNARIGENCRIHVGVSIGAQCRLGNNVYIGPGAKIFGDIIIADGIRIGANSVVNHSFLEPNVTIAGAPARIVSQKGWAGSGSLKPKVLEDVKKT